MICAIWSRTRSSCSSGSECVYRSVLFHPFVTVPLTIRSIALRRYYMWLMPTLAFVIPTLLPAWLNGESLYNSFYVATMLRYTISLHSTWLVNSAAHIWGYKQYDRTIKSSDNIFVSVAAYGEGWHNYHHVFPWDYKAAELGNYRLNFTTAFIDFFARIGEWSAYLRADLLIDFCIFPSDGFGAGWAYDLKTVSKEIITRRAARTGDGTSNFSDCIPNGAQHEHEQQQHHHHHHSHENSIWGWDDEDMLQLDRENALITHKEDKEHAN